ncbi:X-linked retinitis pigmentosa GTPase regulator-interacting protein 1 [Phytophthora pseudosyringae]|uniref:X-linked retinitis pigmentosa GTPase regulator-interacting protein 1 n=1 Tax=Phytophthora pseudosyringae TaxID=221518 RepID=A0A8T1VUA2_9STRA|nr:X-linked retinitis pigmentosa GTPase regulator-interacting protein 1 [Phytophthora pseudosyringae]
MPSEYEDKYLLLRDENTALKKKKNEQEATIKRMYTKLAMIEEKLSKRRQGDPGTNNQDDPEAGANKAAVVPVRRDLDTEKFVAALKSENATLRKKNQALMEKNRWLEERSRASSAVKRLGGAAASKTRAAMQKKPAARNPATVSGGFAGNTLEKQTESARKLHRDTFSGDLEVALKKRLVVAEKQLTKLQKENEQLRVSSSRLQLKPRRDNNEESGPSDEDDDEKSEDNNETVSLEHDQMKRELRDRQAQLAILNARYENLESNALAEREIQEKTLGQMEQMNRQVHKLRTQLQDAIMEKEELEVRLMKAGDQEKDCALLRDQNRRLEERMTSLCESPFINDAFQRKERIDKLFDLEKLTQEQKATISHMTEENQKLQGIIRGLQSSIKQLKQAKDRLEQDLAQMARHLMEERNARTIDAIKSSTMGIVSVPAPRPEPLIIVRPSTPEPHHQPAEKRDACSSPVNNNSSPVKRSVPSLNVGGGVVRRKYGELPLADSFLDTIGAEGDTSVKHLRNRVHVLQIAHLKAMQELERCEKMLQAQTNINCELALEIEELTVSKISSSNQLQRRMKDLELLCEERQQRIQTLQAEIRQLKYAREKMLLKMREADDNCSEESASDDEESEVASLSESLVLAARDLAPGEQLLELGIVSGSLDSSVVGINSSTFVLSDFYDFESQSTALLMGNRPEYNLSATFKVTVDGFFLRYLASESILLEVHQAIRGDFKLIGKASVRLSKLLQSKGVVKEPRLAVKSLCCNSDGGSTVLGTLNVILRLSTPISEIWQVHLRSYPQDIQLLSTIGKLSEAEVPSDVLCAEDLNDDAGRSTNELQITVFACRKLRSYGKHSDGSISRIPSSYAHYQLLGFPDVFTNIVPESANPEYDLSCSRQAFALEVDACLLRFFSQFCFSITVFDDQVELDDSAHEDGVVGRCGLILSDLVNGENIRGWFPLKDQNDQHAGDISVLIQWKDPFQVLQLSSSQRARGVNGRPIDMHSLDFDQQHALLSMFSSDMDGRVNYRQFLHYATPSEELELLVAKLKERFEYAVDSELITSVQDALTAGLDARDRKRMLISTKAMVQAGEKYGIFLSDVERDHLLSTFGVTTANASAVGDAGKAHDISIAVNYLLLHINPRLSCIERLLCHKIRQTMRGYVLRQRKRKTTDIVPPPKLFEKFDEAKCGRVTRSAFRKCLSALGFDLMNVDSEYRELVRNHTKQPRSDEHQHDSIGSNTIPSLQSRVDLDEEVLEDVAAKAKAKQHSKQPTIPNRGSGKKATNPEKEAKVLAQTDPVLTAKPATATTEFHRRKQAFTNRMKAIASISSKNLVYEHVEKRLQDQRVQAKERGAKALSQQERLQQQVQQLHVPQNVHHDAARTLQRQYRQYKEQQQQQRETNHVETTIMEADLRLQNIFSKWTLEDLNGLEDSILAEIERDVPEAKRTRLLSKKQLSYFLSKAPRIALPPALLWQLMDYFSVAETGLVAYRSLLSFIFSTSTEESEREKKQRLSVLRRVFFDVGNASHTFVSAGDMKETGRISFKKFHECLSRLGVQLSPKELHLVTIMFDANGYEILYHALLHILTQLPHYQQLVVALGRCHRFGISSLRENIITFVNSDDGRMTQEELLRVLMHLSSEDKPFEPKDASLLFQMISGNDDTTKRISILDLSLRLEAAAKYGRKTIPDEWNRYEMRHLQRLAWNCRKLICGTYSDLKYEFERFDWGEKGFVSLVEFVAIARQNGFLLFTEDQLKGIAKSFGVKTNGSFGINYRQFLDWTTPPPPVDMDVVEKKLRKSAQEQADKLPSKQLSEVFANWNKIILTEAESASEGVIRRSNFVKICITRLSLPLDENEMRALLYTYDPQLNDQIDCGAFLRMNWRDATITYQERTKEANEIAKAKAMVVKIGEKLQDHNSVPREIAKAFLYSDDSSNAFVECGQFLLAMRKLEIPLSPDDVQSLFIAFGEQPGRRKLNFVKFFKDSFGLSLLNSCEAKPDYQLSSENEKRLRCALEAAVRFSLSKFQHCLVQFQEFCVLHQFDEITPSKLWRQMEANGLVELLSKRAVGLLSQKFSTTFYDDDAGSSLSVSLKAVHTYLKDFLKDMPAKVSRKHEIPSAATELTASIAHAQLPRAPVAILSDFLDLCDECGVDFRGELEARDSEYTGSVTAMELKEALLRLGIAKSVFPSSAEVVIGQLVRQFRSAERTDAVHYTKMLYEATKPVWASADSRWYDQMTEKLRSRIRSKANLAGQIDHSDTTNYSRLDAAFSHFDREKKGFLTAESFCSGLRALNYELAPAQLSILMLNMCIFRHGGGGLSRTEFDSFVLDPYGSRLLKSLSDRLYLEVEPQSQATMPRVAYLSRLLMECGGSSHHSNLPKEAFWTQLERALERQVTALEKVRLQHLFDVGRDGHIAYKLFLKVMSQWRTSVNVVAPVFARDTKVAEQRKASISDQRAAAKPEKQPRTQETTINAQPPCACDAILRSLYNQMSSIDFDSQLDIVEEYLRLKDHKHTGSIKMKQLKRVFDQIGLSLSADAFTSLQMYFPGLTSSSAKEEEERGLVAYGKLLLALEVLHEKSGDNVER